MQRFAKNHITLVQIDRTPAYREGLSLAKCITSSIAAQRINAETLFLMKPRKQLDTHDQQ
jgi:hypothetical protein